MAQDHIIQPVGPFTLLSQVGRWSYFFLCHIDHLQKSSITLITIPDTVPESEDYSDAVFQIKLHIIIMLYMYP